MSSLVLSAFGVSFLALCLNNNNNDIISIIEEEEEEEASFSFISDDHEG